MVLQGGIEEEETGMQDSPEMDPAFVAMEQEFRKTLAQMQRRQGMMTFSNEFKRVLDQLVEAHIHKTKLSITSKELTARVETDTVRLETLSQQTLQFQAELLQQKQELEAAWKKLDISHVREQELQELVDDLRRQVTKLSSDLEQKSRLGLDQGDDYGMMAKNREGLAKEREKLSQEVVTLKDRLARAASTRADLEKQILLMEAQVQDMAQEMEAHSNELSKETRLKEKLQEEVRILLQDLERRTANAANLSFQLAQAHKNATRGETALRDQRLANERLAKENESLQGKLGRLQTEMETQVAMLDKVMQDGHRKNAELKTREDELSKMRVEIARMTKARDAAEKRARQEESRRADLEAEKERMRGVRAALERAVDQAEKQRRAQRKLLDKAVRERDVLQQQVLKAAVTISEQQKSMQNVDDTISQLRLQVKRYSEDLQQKQSELDQLTTLNIKHLSQEARLLEKIEELETEIGHYKSQLENGEELIQRAEQKQADQIKICDALRADIASMSKALALAKDEALELKEKLETSIRQEAQLKEEITSREYMLFKSRSELQRCDRDRDNVRVQMKALQLQIETQRSTLNETRLAEEDLQRLVRSDRERIEALERSKNKAEDDRDLLAAQLVRRSQELTLLHEKTFILSSALEKGKTSYAQRLEDVRLLKIEIKRLRQEKNNLTTLLKNSSELRLELYQTSRQLTQAQVKCRALEEEMRTPLNVHRWRKLEGTDPPHYALITKVHVLQKRLLSVSAQLLMRETQLREVEQRSLKLQLEAARTPGPQLAIQLQHAQNALTERANTIKCLQSEIRMLETKSEANQLDNLKTQDEISELKQKYFQLKKREQQLRTLHSACQVGGITLTQLLGRARFLGGGYNLAMQPPRELTPFVIDSGSEASQTH